MHGATYSVSDRAAEVSDWREVDAELRRIARRRGADDYEEGRWLLAAERTRPDRHSAVGSFFEYIERIFGYVAKVAMERVRVARALESLPELAAALREGDLSWSVIRE